MVILTDAVMEFGKVVVRKKDLFGAVVNRRTALSQRNLHRAAAGAKAAPTIGIDAVGTAGTLLEVLLLAAPAEQVGTAGTLVGLGQVLQIAKASNTFQLLATAAAGPDTAAIIPNSRSNCILMRCSSASCGALGLGSAALLLGLLPHRCLF